MCSSVASSFNTNWLLSQNIYNKSQQKFWCYIFKSLREPQLDVVIFTSRNPHARYATSSMTKETACVLVVSQKYLCSSPEMGHLVVECIRRMYAGARAPIGTQLHTRPEACWRVCVCAICIRRKTPVYPYLPQWAEDNRTESEGRYTLGCFRVVTAHLVMPVWKGQLQVAGFAAINFASYGDRQRKHGLE